MSCSRSTASTKFAAICLRASERMVAMTARGVDARPHCLALYVAPPGIHRVTLRADIAGRRRSPFGTKRSHADLPFRSAPEGLPDHSVQALVRLACTGI